MLIVRTVEEARAAARALPRPLGFVPTMGALHAGHAALFELARSASASVVASIFVNPLQFGPGEDFGRYPRVFEPDVELLERAGVDLLYAPTVDAVYGAGFASRIEVGAEAAGFEGALRPGHFSGVATIVAKLLLTFDQPDVVYVGQKDAQQAVVLGRVLADLNFATTLTVCPIVREADGLALSSRNVYLSAREREVAPSLYRAVAAVAAVIEAGDTDAEAIKRIGLALLEAPLTSEYLDIVDPLTFAPQNPVARPALVVAAARAGRTRLLDNVMVR